ncbi:MAG: hypothetical protein HGB12_16320 [Bacteroidetes bacterium]|nr:hypothetical protein [Bacteroidota bacterium]
MYFNEANLKNAIRSVGALLIVNYYYYKKLFESELGAEIAPKEVTAKLQQISAFMKLESSYYYSPLEW